MHQDAEAFARPMPDVRPPEHVITLEQIDSTDVRDGYGLGHSRRVAVLSGRLARAISVDAAFVAQVSLAGLLHDVGKRAVPRAILTKPGRLTSAEALVVRSHPREGVVMIGSGVDAPGVLDGILHHHERFDGAGYPDGLSGERIPLSARIVCIADSFDAMTSWRPYKRAMTRLEAMREVRREAGSQFDPLLVEVFGRVDLEVAKRDAVPAYLGARRAA